MQLPSEIRILYYTKDNQDISLVATKFSIYDKLYLGVKNGPVGHFNGFISGTVKNPINPILQQLCSSDFFQLLDIFNKLTRMNLLDWIEKHSLAAIMMRVKESGLVFFLFRFIVDCHQSIMAGL